MIRSPHLRTRHLVSAVVLAVAPLALFAAPASADGSHANLYCTNTFTEELNPPNTSEFGQRDATSHGMTGTADCTGTIDGYQVTGTGIFGQDAQGTGDCFTGSGQIQAELRIPTTGGVKTVVASSDYAYDNGGTGPLGTGTAGLTGEMTGAIIPLELDGDCLNTPIRHNHAEFIGTIIT
jgi:hypothetical protein